MKKIAFICANYGSSNDGIGHYTKKLVEAIKKRNINVSIFSGKTSNSLGKKLFSFAMFRAIWKVKPKEFNSIFIEYPFPEYNPLIIVPIIKLKILSSIYHTKNILSIHEYYRANKFRKSFIDILLLLFKICLVTDEQTRRLIKSNKRKIFIREIPSNIDISQQSEINKQQNSFVFFGLINKSKAFNEMLEAWHLFNQENQYHLYIITSSDTSYIDTSDNISIFKDAEDKDVATILRKSQYAILPILPNVNINNATFMATIKGYCIPIGIFSDNIIGRNIFINCKSYSPNDILSALKLASSLGLNEYQKRVKLIMQISKTLPSFEKTSDLYLKIS